MRKYLSFLTENRVFRLFIVVFCILWTTKEVLIPLGAAILYSTDFMELVNKCDVAMESSWYYRQDNTIDKSEKIQMLDCHDYDKVRKILLMAGLPEDYLSYLGLKSLDLYQKNPEEFVKLHRFKER